MPGRGEEPPIDPRVSVDIVSSDSNSRRLEGERKQEQAREQGSRRREPDGCDPNRIEFHGENPWEWGQAPSPVHGVDDGPTNRVDRLRACGNGVVPQVAARAFTELLKVTSGFENVAGIGDAVERAAMAIVVE